MNIQWKVMNRPFAHQFVSRSDVMAEIKRAGFTEILFVQCCYISEYSYFGYIGRYDLATGQFKMDG